MEVTAGTNRESTIESRVSFLKCCTDWLPATTGILVFQSERIIPTKFSVMQQIGFRLQSSSLGEELVVENTKSNAWTDDSEDLNDQNFILNRDCEEKFSIRSISELEGSTPHEVHTAEEESTDGRKNRKDENLSIVSESQAEVSSSVSLIATNLSLSKPRWPLLRIEASVGLDSLRESEDQTLPNQSTPATPQSQINMVSFHIESYFRRVIHFSKDDENCLTPSTKSSGESEISLKLVSSDFKQFNYEELKQATSKFSTDNLIGEGGSSHVFKGCLPNGKLVAVKVLKSYKEAWNDFVLEVEITSSLMHKNIIPLIGVCTEDNNLILVYDFLPKGSLEESLHGIGKKAVLPWEVRFKVAVAVAEALNYLHDECSRPVIHRDVKSSNILLSTEFQPQLSDFGLAIWGATDSSYVILEDMVGTLGYIAPEYFMHGKVSDKIDVYSFGVVLLELLSGRRPIGAENLKGQESLVKWAIPMLEKRDTEALLDRNLNDDIDIAQMQRMVDAANLCITQSPRHRPKVGQILKLLRGEKDVKEWVQSGITDVTESGNQEDGDNELDGKPHLDFSILDTDYDATWLGSVDTVPSFSAEQKQQPLKLRDYLKIAQD